MNQLKQVNQMFEHDGVCLNPSILVVSGFEQGTPAARGLLVRFPLLSTLRDTSPNCTRPSPIRAADAVN